MARVLYRPQAVLGPLPRVWISPTSSWTSDYVRQDGKTLIGQPLIEQERLWTIDDIRRLSIRKIKDPLQK